jgi:hypothetical protein
MRAVVCGMVMALASTPATAESVFSADYMLPGCRWWLADEMPDVPPAMVYKAGLCVGNVAGISFMLFANMGVFQEGLRSPKPKCADIPPNVTLDRIVRVVVAYIEARPSRMHEAFNDLAVEALQETWPCLQ